MKNRIKTIFSVVLIFIIGIIIYIGFGLFKMGIEDKYGDLQNVYYKSNNGDLIVNHNSKKFGKIHKTWKDISIITKEKDTFDLWYWENKINKQSSKIYRPKNKTEIRIQELTYSKIETLIKNKKLKFLIDCKVNLNVITEQVLSNFNLKTDYTEFQKKMGELDTLKVWISHSVCTYQGNEKLEITKKNGKIKIKSEYKEGNYRGENKWKIVYEKLISENDTIWNFGKFLKRNENRQKNETNNFAMLVIKHKENKMKFFTNGLVDLNRFMADYYKTMLKIYPENKEKIYWSEPIEVITKENSND